MSGRAFSRGVGEWVGSAEVYDAGGRFAGTGRDVRSVQADDRAGRVTVEVTFDGPFSLSGVYTIADHGSHRVYEGPLNVGFAEALGDGLVAAHNYWPDLGLSQRFFLMVLPDGTRQLSLALLSRGERLCWTVVGEYQRRPDPATTTPLTAEPAAEPSGDDPAGGRGQPLLLRSGCWSGRLQHLDTALEPAGTVDHVETVAADPVANDGRSFAIELSGLGFAGDASFTLMADGTEIWTPAGEVVGSAMLSGGRGLSGQFHHTADGLRMWRREVASRDGTMKAVLYLWYRGEQCLGAVYGTLAFDPA
ncbi:hypothetical protein [Candidatus Poriferisocius sp.]|uniref:hypothetical protein n=1 Tax=Candidatus Poriferisocius sp. TaxID=3101276 RepID=UPI003B0151FF